MLRAVRPRSGVREVRPYQQQMPDVQKDVPKRGSDIFLVNREQHRVLCNCGLDASQFRKSGRLEAPLFCDPIQPNVVGQQANAEHPRLDERLEKFK